jgi:hypothetical protein
MVWVWEIVERLEVTVPLALGGSNGKLLSVDGAVGGQNAARGISELGQLLHNVELAYWYICAYFGDPCKRGMRQKSDADLDGLEPAHAIIRDALSLIDCVMIGPSDRVAQILASDERLHASARVAPRRRASAAASTLTGASVWKWSTPPGTRPRMIASGWNTPLAC